MTDTVALSPSTAALDPKALRNAFGCFATGVVVVTAFDADGTALGMTINSFSSLSLDPPLLLWSIANSSRNLAAFRDCRQFALHVLHAGQQDLARRFASRELDRFQGLPADLDAGAPLLEDFHARFTCTSEMFHVGGDHTILIGRVTDAQIREVRPLLFYRGQFQD